MEVRMNFDPFPELNSERLLLRRLDVTDVNNVLELRSNPETMKFIPRPLLMTSDDAIAHIATIDQQINSNEGINWAITLKGQSDCLGIIGYYRVKPEHFRAEIGYMILPQYAGRGLVSEAIKCVVTYGLETMNLHSIEAVIDPLNEASAKVLQKNGFVLEGHLRENEYFDGQFIDSMIYSLIRPV